MRRQKLILCVIILVTSLTALVGGAIWLRATPEERYQQGLQALERGDLSSVFQQVQFLRDYPLFKTKRRLLEGALSLRAERYEPALLCLRELPTEGDHREHRLLWLGECLYRLDRYLEASTFLSTLVDEQPDHVEARKWLAAIYFDMGSMDGAVEELKQVIDREPNDRRAHHLLGFIYWDFFEHYPESIEHYRTALSLNPTPYERDEIISELAQALIKQRDYQAALDELTNAAPNKVILALQSECQLNLGRLENAIQLLELAKQAPPSTAELEGLQSDDRFVLLLTARIAQDQKDYQKAIDSLAQILDDNRHDFEARYQLGLTYERSHRTEDAKAELKLMEDSQQIRKELSKKSREAMENPFDPVVRFRLAELCGQFDMPKLAES